MPVLVFCPPEACALKRQQSIKSIVKSQQQFSNNFPFYVIPQLGDGALGETLERNLMWLNDRVQNGLNLQAYCPRKVGHK